MAQACPQRRFRRRSRPPLGEALFFFGAAWAPCGWVKRRIADCPPAVAALAKPGRVIHLQTGMSRAEKPLVAGWALTETLEVGTAKEDRQRSVVAF